MQNFKELHIWQESMELVKEIYIITSAYPEAEKFGLVQQMRRAAVSIPSNIAEGAGRNSLLEFKRFLTISISSSNELETQLGISEMMDFIEEDVSKELQHKINILRKRVYSFIKAIDHSTNTISKT
ncbi:MAG TPA: hypothetical protein DHW15_11975 [Bacteroidetes bacterium]|jgi:four helix bundle protein|nr:MAG: hypothetical protein ABR94_09235 [Sphingobacteriales bacterium BACL12 MAG-120802-bin5]HCK22838.1 hypothetical protein [Bacteroidota bacterium]